MNQNLTVINERVDDIPLLLAQLKRMGVQELLDKHFPTHGNWQGLSLGWVTIIWLGHILSQKDHRLNQVQSWSEKRLETLRILSFESLRALDFSDDRLEGVLRYLSDDESWVLFEQELGGNLIQVYDLSPERVRLDSTTASSYCGVNESGLFQWGHSKDHRPDLVETMTTALPELGNTWRVCRTTGESLMVMVCVCGARSALVTSSERYEKIHVSRISTPVVQYI